MIHHCAANTLQILNNYWLKWPSPFRQYVHWIWKMRLSGFRIITSWVRRIGAYWINTTLHWHLRKWHNLIHLFCYIHLRHVFLCGTIKMLRHHFRYILKQIMIPPDSRLAMFGIISQTIIWSDCYSATDLSRSGPPFKHHELTLILAWLSNHMHHIV